MEKIKHMGVPAMEQAVNAYYTITASSEFREAERLREKARNDEAQALHHAKLEGKEEGKKEGKIEGEREAQMKIARNMIGAGLSVDQIMAMTGLSQEDIKQLIQE